MKLLALIALAATLVLTGCSGGGESTTPAAPAATNPPAAPAK
jgi:PBP1b-binding outer membrane lipoprotein LpoB